MDLTLNQVIEKVKNAGIVGAGGAGFPAHIKLNSNIKTLIANAASCEPLATSDLALISNEPKKLFKAMSIVMNITNAKEGIIAIKGKHKEIVNSIKQALLNYPDNRISVFELDDFYPAGDEFILVYEITKKIVPERALPVEVGCLVQNVTTLIQISEAVEDNPVINRMVTVTGEVKYPQNSLIPIGTSFKDVINLAGGSTTDTFKVIHGGPMTGKLVDNLDTESILKTTSLVLILPDNHILIQKRQQPIKTTLKRSKSVCCQCSMCSDLCPRNLIGHPLLPHKIMRTIAFNLDESEKSVFSAYLCSECGLCSMYSCTMGLIPHHINIEIKTALAKNNFKFKRMYDDYEVNVDIREARKVPTNRLVGRLDLIKYDNQHLATNFDEFYPKEARIKLQQHIGTTSIPTVKVGDSVKIGKLIADIPVEKLGAKIHASINGKIREITQTEIVIRG